MLIIYVGLAGLLIFAAAAAVLGWWLRRHPSRANAERTSRIMHFLFFAALGGPGLVAVFWPGLTHLDALVGLPPLPLRPLRLALGALLAVPGLYLMVASNQSLRRLGHGANAFVLTKEIVAVDIYRRTRNPMSLGYYLVALSLALIAGSTLLLLTVVFGLIPAHLFFLKYFEEQELELRLGEAYKKYRGEVPFLLPHWRSDGQDERAAQ